MEHILNFIRAEDRYCFSDDEEDECTGCVEEKSPPTEEEKLVGIGELIKNQFIGKVWNVTV